MYIKKAVSAVLAAAVSITLTVPTFASGILSAIEDISNSDSIKILYNGELISGDDAQNIDGRVMLPFRKVLESMGATVDYDNDTKTVTASRGDTEIRFTVGDNVIYINKNGESTAIQTDIAPFIKNDKTLVPVRFISQALGMQVGWDSGSVLIVDKDGYLDEVGESVSKLDDFIEKISDTDYNFENTKIDFTFVTNENDVEKTSVLNTEFTSQSDENATKFNGTISADLTQLGSDIQFENEEFGIIFTDDKVYMNTSFAKKLLIGGVSPDISVKGALLGASAPASDWVCVDTSALLERFFGDGVFEDADLSDIGEIKPLSEVLDDIISDDGDATLVSAAMAEIITEAYKLLDKYVTVTDNSVSIVLDGNFVTDLTEALGATKIDAVNLLDMADFNVNSDINYTDTSLLSDVKIGFGLNLFDEQTAMKFEMNKTNETKDSVSIEIPDDAVDITTLIK